MPNILSNLKPAPGSRKKEKRVGRGQGSGHGGTSTRGHKGQRSRSGESIRPWFEGGQMPLIRRIPKRGFRNPFKVEYQIVNLSRLQELIDKGKISPDAKVTPELLYDVGAVSKKTLPVKILGDGELKVALEISAHAFSKSALQKIQAIGGKAIKL
ncbi:LSU ribosomal protein L15P [Candidatus Kryptobacter tengchongensis]|uniref:Large ribosomal subunit protein uL15 n=1 Tax=Kryptobacter tengchongensis TaxID=1643429 RepID=A0A656D4Y3_KRYT1|nr:50S ribosomal protein L15 [Candidatus Kryptobacter tengchongensis]CUS98215.1 LSU ribosomal protein L15P [Candidatus Kryptobacter tengchongensis]CUT01939.1 LSU ribosomal protein L15P [Candidatus Kryptobacter tengchongensis]CUU08943.1 LSU ribosomal protein L15P [Candidatus Kryptobacter tengchongensis]